MSLEDKIKEQSEKNKKPNVSIPSGSCVKALLTGIKYTKKGEAAASIMGGIGVSFAFVGYYKGDDMEIYVPTIDYSDPKNIKFPADIKNIDGTTERPGLNSKPIYLTPGVLSAKNMVAGDDENSTALLYAYHLGRTIGTQMQVPFMNQLMGSGLVKLEPSNLGMTEKEIDINFPIVHLYRYTDMKYQKADLIDGHPKEGAQKQFEEQLGTWRKGSDSKDPKGNMLANIPLEFITPEVAIAIISALAERQLEKKREKESFGNVTPGVADPF
jgi:hypothetical protein